MSKYTRTMMSEFSQSYQVKITHKFHLGLKQFTSNYQNFELSKFDCIL